MEHIEGIFVRENEELNIVIERTRFNLEEGKQVSSEFFC